jgi:SulP family sulfate permease
MNSFKALAARPPAWHLFVPKLVTALRDGYGLAEAKADHFAGLTVSVVALPLSLALAIASGVSPGRGLFTAVVAGAIVSGLGGSRFQIAGPTGAFVVVVAGIVQQFGYEGLVAAMLIAGVLLIATGLARVGTYIKYIPLPVVTGFTSGIAVVIFSSQLGDLLGLALAHVPNNPVDRLIADARTAGSFNGFAVSIAAGTLATILIVQKYAPRIPAFLVALVFAGTAVWMFKLPVATIGTRFGGIPSMLPAPHLVIPDLATIRMLLPAAFTIYALGGIESLLSAVVADGMTGRRHRANCELVAQGVANIACAFAGGIPATGAIARTATNIRAGARTPIAGIVHSVAILAMMALFAPLARFLPLASLAAVLSVVCWNMAEVRVFGLLLQSSIGDRAVLIVTFLLTVFVDLTFAIGAGVALASLVFARSLASNVSTKRALPFVSDDVDEISSPNPGVMERPKLPPGVEVFQLNGPLFFAAAAEYEDILSRSGGIPRILILRMAGVPLIDATGAAAFRRFVTNIQARGTNVVLSELKAQPGEALKGMTVIVPSAQSFEDSLHIAKSFLPTADVV